MRSAFIAVAVLLGATTTARGEDEAHEKAETAEAAKNAPALAAAMKDAKVSLANGLKASETAGKPISGKFELEDGKLQLSVYTAKSDKFFEVIVDPKTGKVAKTEPIAEGDDLAAAKKQAEAMGKTKRSLGEVVAKAEKANAGYKAVSVAPEIENGVAHAEVGLLKGTESKQVDEKI
jgi:hypothetical protein